MISGSKQVTGAGLMMVLSGFGYWVVDYVDAKHRAGIEQVQEAKEEVRKLRDGELNNKVMLASMSATLTIMSERVKVMDQRILELYRDSKKESEGYSALDPQEEEWKAKSRN